MWTDFTAFPILTGPQATHALSLEVCYVHNAMMGIQNYTRQAGGDSEKGWNFSDSQAAVRLYAEMKIYRYTAMS